MMGRFFAVLAWCGVFLSLAGCGGPGSGGGGGNKGTATTPLNVNVGDAPTDRIVSCAFTINSVALTSGTGSTTVLSTPTQVEFSHLAGALAPLSLAQLSNTSYTGITITVSNPQVTIINDAGTAVAATASLSQSTLSVPISANFNTTASTLNLELNLAQSVTLNLAANPPTATVSPVFSANVVTNASATQQTPSTGGFQAVTGAVAGVTGASFTMDITQAGQTLTFGTNSNTTFNGVTGVSALQGGNIVQVNGVTNADGTLLATSVSLEVGGGTGMELEGLITSVTGAPATSLAVVTRDVTSGSASSVGPGAVVSVDLTSVPANKYLVNSSADLTGVTIPFDASHIAEGQSVEVDYAIANMPPSGAGQVQLRDGTWGGTISGTIVPLGNGGAQFTLTLPSDSALSKLTGGAVTSLTVIRQPSTVMLNGVTVTPATAVRARGPLFFNGSSYTLVAVTMTTP